MIEDETKTGFKLVVNDFLQNETALPKVNIQKIPSGGENRILVLLENGMMIKRKLPALDKGFHKYVIYRDYQGKYKMRYRGIHTNLSQSAIMVDYSEKVNFKIPELDVLAVADTSSRFEEWNQDISQPAVEKEDQALAANDSIPSSLAEQASIKASVPKESDLVTEKEIENLKSSEQVTEKTEAASSKSQTEDLKLNQKESEETEEIKPAESDTKIEAEIKDTEPPTQSNEGAQSENPELKVESKQLKQEDTFPGFIAEFNNTEFEFDKLKKAKAFLEKNDVETSQALQILKGLKYDQSRLDFLQVLLSKQSHLKSASEELITCFDYDLTKEQAKKLFQ